MKLLNRIQALADWGMNIQEAARQAQFQAIKEKAQVENGWFTSGSVDRALVGIRDYLDPDKLKQWTDPYQFPKSTDPKGVGIVMAGNIPLVGFHDLICVLVSGHRALVKLSSSDTVLVRFVLDQLPSETFQNAISIQEKLTGMDAVIATGSNNTARYFEYYFRSLPRLIRKNRTGVSVLLGNETKKELQLLVADITHYFGLGCRNVSKVYMPSQYDLQLLVDLLSQEEALIAHNKYKNNYDYYKSIYLVNRDPFIDSGNHLFIPSDQIASPVSITYYESYDSIPQISEVIRNRSEEIQCVISGDKLSNSIPFGLAQRPQLWDYADGVDTLRFLLEL